jgi:uroporphyrinogen-III decarboxylase
VTSRERLLGAITHQPIDRVPISTYELVGWNENAWENKEPSYRVLMDAIRERTDCIYMTGVDWRSRVQNAGAAVEHRSWREGNSRYTRTVWHTPNGDLTTLHRVDDNVHTTWTLEHMLKDIDDIDKYLSIPWEPPLVDMTRFYREQEKLGERGVMMISVGDPICQAAELFEMGDFLVYALTYPDRILYLLEAIHERQMHNLKQILTHDVRNVIFRICGPEYATPPYLTPEHFRMFVTRFLTDICQAIRSAGGFARVHCHGKIGLVLDQIVEAGAQGLDPIEPPPDGDITLGEVKRRYGRELTLFGNIELRELECSSEERIRYLVEQAMAQAKEGGGYVLMPTAAPINIPLSPVTERNYLAYIDAGLKYGAY